MLRKISSPRIRLSSALESRLFSSTFNPFGMLIVGSSSPSTVLASGYVEVDDILPFTLVAAPRRECNDVCRPRRSAATLLETSPFNTASILGDKRFSDSAVADDDF
jgi:hypothetical protein